MLFTNQVLASSFVVAVILINHVSAQAGVSSCGRRVSPLSGVKCGARGTVARPQVIVDIIAPVPETQQQLLRDCQVGADRCLFHGNPNRCDRMPVSIAVVSAKPGSSIITQGGADCSLLPSKTWGSQLIATRTRRSSTLYEALRHCGSSSCTNTSQKDCVDGECFTTYKTQLTSDAQSYDDNTFQVCPPGGLSFYGIPYNCAQMSSNGVCPPLMKISPFQSF